MSREFFTGLAEGALLEALYAYGVLLIAQRRAKSAALLSMIWMLLMRYGIGDALQSRAATVGLVLGYGIGCWAAITWIPEPGNTKGGK